MLWGARTKVQQRGVAGGGLGVEGEPIPAAKFESQEGRATCGQQRRAAAGREQPKGHPLRQRRARRQWKRKAKAVSYHIDLTIAADELGATPLRQASTGNGTRMLPVAHKPEVIRAI